MSVTLLVNANALQIPLADGSVQMVVTSPPYWGLRNYNIDGQLGLESTPELYVDHMVEVFREVKRVLRDDGTLWLNLGDSYAREGSDNYQSGPNAQVPNQRAGRCLRMSKPPKGLKHKDLIGIPWLVAFALQADGWYLRSEITWCKKAPMPESVTDRPTSATEKLFLFAKSPRYFYDAEAVRVQGKEWNGQAGTFGRNGGKATELEIPGQASVSHRERDDRVPAGRNLWNYWILGPEPFSGSHYAVFPTALVEPCIKAGTSERGCCPTCGKAWERVTELGEIVKDANRKTGTGDHPKRQQNTDTGVRYANLLGDGYHPGHHREKRHIGFRPACTCPPHDPIPCTVLDPFAGSGTSLLVARRLGRHAVGLDLSYAYLSQQARKRLQLDALDEWTNGKSVETAISDLPLFSSPE